MPPIPNLGKTLMRGHATNFNCFSPPHGVGRQSIYARPCLRALALSRGPCAMALGPLFEGGETRFTNGMTIARIVLFQQAVADQQRDTTLADLDRCGQDNVPGAALAKASCTCGGCRFVAHVTSCYYDIYGGFGPTARRRLVAYPWHIVPPQCQLHTSKWTTSFRPNQRYAGH